MSIDIEKLFSLEGKTAIVTGASSGLGVEFARALASAGANVVIAARRIERLQGLSRELSDQGMSCLAVQCDVTQYDQVDNLVNTACEKFGRVDVMINNAASLPGAGMVPETLTVDAARMDVEVNLLGVWYGCQLAGIKMLTDGKGGSIINVSSIGGKTGFPDVDPMYGATKAGVANLTRMLAASWGNRRVRVNTVFPGWFPSEMNQDSLGTLEGETYALSHIPMNRVGKLSELWGPIVFLASDASSYMNGAEIVLDGGAVLAGRKMSPEILKAMEQIPGGLGKRIGI